MFDFDWLYYDNDFMRHEKTAENAETDQETFDTWTVTLSGAVQNESTRTLPELVDAFGTEKRRPHCTARWIPSYIRLSRTASTPAFPLKMSTAGHQMRRLSRFCPPMGSWK